MSNPRQVKTPEGYEGWHWMDGPVFLYNKDDPADSADAQILALEWGEVVAKVRRLQFEARRRTERVCETEPIILSIEEARNDANNDPGHTS
jgi:hypothetical protein